MDLKEEAQDTQPCLTLHAEVPQLCGIECHDGSLVTGGADGCLRVWELPQADPVAIIAAHKKEVRCLCELDGGRVVSGGKDGKLTVWEIQSRKAITAMRGHTSSVNCVIKLHQGAGGVEPHFMR